MSGGTSGSAGTPLNTFTPTEALYDLDRPPSATEHSTVTKLRLLQTYFNRHFQLYGRRVHLFAYFDGHAYDAQEDAARHMREASLDILWSVRPFAVIEAFPGGPDDGGAFVDTFARAGAVSFLPGGLQLAERLRRVPDRIWGYEPTTDQMADLYTTYVCRKVVGQPVALSGDSGQNGKTRRLALLSPDASRPPLYHDLRTAVQRRLRACGAPVVAEGQLTPNGEGGGVGAPSSLATETPATMAATAMMQRFKTSGVTTILWLGCNDQNIGPAALAANYHPEWILLGDGLRESTFTVVADNSDPAFDHHAMVVTPHSTLGALSGSHCYEAQREVDTSLPENPEVIPRRVAATVADAGPGGTPPPLTVANDAYLGCFLYSMMLQTVGAIQLGGARLTADSLAAGVHSLPYLHSPDPQTPSCFYGDGNTCVRDATAAYWDSAKTCFRTVEGGRRYLAGEWPDGNINSQIRGDEPCGDPAG